MLEDRINTNLKFTSEFSSFLDSNFDKMFSEAVTLPDTDLSDSSDDDELLDLSEENGELVVNLHDNKIKNKIATLLIENAVQDRLFSIQYHASKNTEVSGYE